MNSEAVIRFVKRLWEAYEAFVTPFYPWIQWGIGIGAVLLLLGWGANRLGPTFHYCPQCGKVIPKKWNPCRMCGYMFEPGQVPGQAPGQTPGQAQNAAPPAEAAAKAPAGED